MIEPFLNEPPRYSEALTCKLYILKKEDSYVTIKYTFTFLYVYYFSHFLSLAYVDFLTRPKRDPKFFLMYVTRIVVLLSSPSQ